eukprot:PLAT13543.1.p1 GENE.PLAT13543.1~~PLAT13543.1.p1  ORF type:complete len:156 (-),score=44.00 PLAT13543.1:132-599(-)
MLGESRQMPESRIAGTRFLLSLLHFFATISVFYTKGDNVMASLPPQPLDQLSSQFEDGLVAVDTVLGWSLTCFAVELLAGLTGTTLFFPVVNVIYCLLHGAGLLLTVWFIVDVWAYTTFLPLFLLFSLLPALLEGVIFFVQLFFSSHLLSYTKVA